MANKTVAMKLGELKTAEETNFKGTTRHLGESVELLNDIEGLYEKMTPLLKHPGGDIDTSDQLLAFVIINNEFMMSRLLLTKSSLAVLRMYQGDAFAHLRRTIESCAFAVRMSKHHKLSRIWAEAGTDKNPDGPKYKAYRDAFRSQDVFPKKQTHPDYDPLLMTLSGKFDLCSKLIHGSIFGMSGHFGTVPKDKNTTLTRHVNLFDMPPDTFVSSFFFILETHRIILQLFGRIFKPHTTDFSVWQKEYDYVEGKINRHIVTWGPRLKALNEARNQKTSTKP
jgi:hypothetical protein